MINFNTQQNDFLFLKKIIKILNPITKYLFDLYL